MARMVDITNYCGYFTYLLWTSYRLHKNKNIENKIKSSLYNNTPV